MHRRHELTNGELARIEPLLSGRLGKPGRNAVGQKSTADAEALGRSRGGFSRKIQVACDSRGLCPHLRVFYARPERFPCRRAWTQPYIRL